jgi:hypothetical protein
MKAKQLVSKMMGLFIGSSVVLGLMSCSTQMSESKLNPKLGNNGNFEIVEENLPVNWLVYTKNTVKTGDFNFTFDNTDFQSGKQSLRFDVKNCSAEGGWYSPGIAQEIPVKSGEEFSISFWVKNKGSEFSFNIAGISTFGREGTNSIKSTNNTGEWVQYKTTYKTPEKMNKLRIEFNVLQAGIVWIDDVVVERI